MPLSTGQMPALTAASPCCSGLEIPAWLHEEEDVDHGSVRARAPHFKPYLPAMETRATTCPKGRLDFALTVFHFFILLFVFECVTRAEASVELQLLVISRFIDLCGSIV